MRKKKLKLNKTGKLVYKLIISNVLLLISLVILLILYIVKWSKNKNGDGYIYGYKWKDSFKYFRRVS